jgi:hypothetical protein
MDAKAREHFEPARNRVSFDQAGNWASRHRVIGEGPQVAPDLRATRLAADSLERLLPDPAGLTLRSGAATTGPGQHINRAAAWSLPEPTLAPIVLARG